MAHALSLLLVSTLALTAGALWPRAGQAVLLALPPGAPAEAAFAAADWRIRAISQRGPFTLILAMPESPDADPARLRRVSGAAFAWLAVPPDDCRQP
ncbi:hypothetical protein [Sediminicoccus rosea]|jgi:hypothetical protein|uniref:Uncharacterized protein n=1 Tax=Sediminicoccus rosea TaxID=1225128 RepID=A0ABZ0PNR7_9PROT|nr:hypothetical protein [Sediminicoccus rosea]WPB87287.1 hypothetical protein R9Z33_10475 [Sediminicoccus rosea]